MSVLLVTLAACQSEPPGENRDRFYSYVDARGNLVTVEAESERASEKEGRGATDQAEAEPASEHPGRPISEADSANPSSAGNKDFMKIRPEQYQSSGQAREKLKEEVDDREDDRFVSYRGPEGEIITRPLDLEAEREAAERREKQRQSDFERLPEGKRFKEGTSRVPAGCCEHLTADAPVLDVDTNFRLDFDAARTVRLGVERPARILRLAPGVGAVEIQSYIRDQGYLAPRLLMLNEQGKPVLKVNSVFTREYSETWARYGYMDGWVERTARDFAYVVFYLPYARVRDGGVALEKGTRKGGGDYRRTFTGELAVTGHVETTRRDRSGG